MTDEYAAEYRADSQRAILEAPHYESRLILAPGIFIDVAAPMPNAWHRFWTRAVLGWRWERHDQ